MQKTNNNDDNLKVKGGEKAMADYFTEQLKAFETEADIYTGLLPAFNAGEVLDTPNPSARLPARIVENISRCSLRCHLVTKPAPPPVHEPFARHRDTGRIKPSSKSTAASSNSDPFTNEEQLALYLRYKAVHSSPTVRFLNGTPLTSSAIWLMQWAAIAEVLPGRGIADCVDFYNQNVQDFQL